MPSPPDGRNAGDEDDCAGNKSWLGVFEGGLGQSCLLRTRQPWKSSKIVRDKSAAHAGVNTPSARGFVLRRSGYPSLGSRGGERRPPFRHGDREHPLGHRSLQGVEVV